MLTMVRMRMEVAFGLTSVVRLDICKEWRKRGLDKPLHQNLCDSTTHFYMLKAKQEA